MSYVIGYIHLLLLLLLLLLLFFLFFSFSSPTSTRQQSFPVLALYSAFIFRDAKWSLSDVRATGISLSSVHGRSAACLWATSRRRLSRPCERGLKVPRQHPLFLMVKVGWRQGRALGSEESKVMVVWEYCAEKEKLSVWAEL